MLTSCALVGINHLFETGYTNENNQYMPKRPKFKFKKKPCINIPANLDTVNVYRLVETYYRGIPDSLYNSPASPYNQLSKVRMYIKFYSNCRCLQFSIPIKDELNAENKLRESDLNPNNSYYSKDYYIWNNGKIMIESFVYGEGYGEYLIFDYYLDKTGDTLREIYKHSESVYVNEVVPKNWKKYPVDW